MDLRLITGAAMSAIREQLPNSSPLAGVEGEGRIDVLASRAIERMAYGCGDPNVAALFEGARPLVDTALLEILGPGRLRR